MCAKRRREYYDARLAPWRNHITALAYGFGEAAGGWANVADVVTAIMAADEYGMSVQRQTAMDALEGLRAASLIEVSKGSCRPWCRPWQPTSANSGLTTARTTRWRWRFGRRSHRAVGVWAPPLARPAFGDDRTPCTRRSSTAATTTSGSKPRPPLGRVRAGLPPNVAHPTWRHGLF